MRNNMLSMKDDSGAIFICDKSRNIGDLMHYVCSWILGTSCIMCAHAFGGFPYSITRVRTRTSNGRTTIIMFCIARRWLLLVLMGVWPKELPEYARQTRKVTQRCANWLVSPYSHVWVVCRVYDTRPNYPLGQHRRKIDWKNRSRHCIHMFLHLTPIVGSLTNYFFKYSSYVLLHFWNTQAMCYYIFEICYVLLSFLG